MAFQKRKIAEILFILGIFGLGLFLRIYQIGLVPGGFFCDEASIGYNAYTILTQGTDEYGTPFPIFFRAFGEYKGPIEIYSTVPFLSLYGMTEYATRIPSALYGTLTLIVMFFLSYELTPYKENRKLFAYSSTFFLAISPWAIQMSRVALEGLMPFTFFTALGTYLFLKAQKRPLLFIFSVFSFTLALYSYFPARIFIPLFGIGLFCTYIQFFIKHKQETFLGIWLLALLLIPLIFNLYTSQGFIRWEQVNIFSHPPQQGTIFQHIASNYFQHFSADFLFLKGDIDMPGQFITRHSVRGIGELYFFQLPLVIFGLIYLGRKSNKTFAILLLWLFFYPTGSMLTTDASPQATRSIIGVIPFQILTAGGLVYMTNYIQKLKNIISIPLFISMSIVICLSFSQYFTMYFTEYNMYASDFWGWQYGARDIVTYFQKEQQSYDDLVMQPEFNAPEIFFKFYSPKSCTKCKIGTPADIYNRTRRQLFALTPEYLAKHPTYHFFTKNIVYYPNHTIAFRIGEIVQ